MKISQSNIGKNKGKNAWNKNLPPEQQPMFGKKQSDYQKEIVGNRFRGKKLSEQTISKKRIAMIGKTWKLVDGKRIYSGGK